MKLLLSIITSISVLAAPAVTLDHGDSIQVSCAPLPISSPTPLPSPIASASPQPTPTPSPIASASPTPAPSPLAGMFDLGLLPHAVVWPENPIITSERSVTTPAQLQSALDTAGTKITIAANLTGGFTVSTSDHEIIAAPGITVGSMFVQKSVKRLKFVGGSYTSFTLDMPKVWWPSEQTNAAWFVEDVLIDGVTVTATEQAFTLRGNRIAIVRSTATAGTYSVWFGSHSPAQASDLIIAGNRFHSAGAQATLRVHDADNVVIVGNVLSNSTGNNTGRHNLRLHGTVNRAVLSRNTLIHNGSMVGINDSGDTDQIGELWFENNVFYQNNYSGFRADAGGPPYIRTLHLRNNKMYSDLHGCFLCIATPAGWDVSGNTIERYQAPPSALVNW